MLPAPLGNRFKQAYVPLNRNRKHRMIIAIMSPLAWSRRSPLPVFLRSAPVEQHADRVMPEMVDAGAHFVHDIDVQRGNGVHEFAHNSGLIVHRARQAHHIVRAGLVWPEQRLDSRLSLDQGGVHLGLRDQTHGSSVKRRYEDDGGSRRSWKIDDHGLTPSLFRFLDNLPWSARKKFLHSLARLAHLQGQRPPSG